MYGVGALACKDDCETTNWIVVYYYTSEARNYQTLEGATKEIGLYRF